MELIVELDDMVIDVSEGIDVYVRQGKTHQYAEWDTLPESIRDSLTLFNQKIKHTYAALLKDVEPEIQT
ncbi:MAG: hypothetical protein EG822_02205 [Deltaproteobacteria bacterium]|nr:hypothetical protein [Deltaproteobacteria bacterium]